MKKVKTGVAGVGHLGKFHTKLLSEIEVCELVGVYDLNFDKAKEIAAEFKTRAFQTMDELLANVEAVSIAATTSSHHAIAKECLEKGVHCFIEKPITATIPEAEELLSLGAKNNLKIQVGHVERFNPALLAVEKYLSNPLFVQSDRLASFNPRGSDVAVVLDLMIHDIDIILSLVKSEVSKVDASGIAVVSDSIDIANARIEFENGAVANVTASRISQKKMRKMRLFQKDAYISVDFNDGTSEIMQLVPHDTPVDGPYMSFGDMGIGDKKKKIIYQQPEKMQVNALKFELDLFVKAVAANTRTAVTGEDALKALKVAEMIINKIDISVNKIMNRF
ncbi:MAG: Gfo/Idh/MocA family oxidoreductase [Ignavibacteriales bacterium]|nr:Gfo/Idh/MocA family oxidoreductase [Ignavibacteriales bacterium]